MGITRKLARWRAVPWTLLIVAMVMPTSTIAARQAAETIPTVRGNTAQTGEFPGPGPSADPEILWRFDTGGGYVNPPVIADGRAFVTGGSGLFAIDAASGARLWQTEFAGSFSSATIAGETLYAGNIDDTFRTQVVALDMTTARPLWTAPTSGRADGVTAAAGRVFVATANPPGSRQATFSAFHDAAGKALWQVTADGQFSRPAVASDLVYVGSADGTLRAFAIADGREAWRAEVGGWVGSPAIAGDLAVVGSGGTLFALDAATGEGRWQFETGAFSALPAVAGGRVYVSGSGDHTLDALDAATGEPVWSYQADSEMGAPSVADGIVYVGTGSGALLAIGAEDGQLRWQLPVGASLATTSAIVADGIAYVGTGTTGELTAVAGGAPALPGASGTRPTGGATAEYASQSFGFRLTYDPSVWEPRNPSADGIHLTDGISSVSISGSSTLPQDAVPCLDESADSLSLTSSRQDYTPMLDASGAPIRQESPWAAFGVYTFIGKAGDRRFERIECRTLPEGRGVVFALQSGPLDAYDKEATTFEALMSGLALG
jgi:outer membrane protein assembly factor BamB